MTPVVVFSSHGFIESPTYPAFSAYMAISLGLVRQGRKVFSINLDPTAPDIRDWVDFEWRASRGVLDWMTEGADQHITEYVAEILRPDWVLDVPLSCGGGRWFFVSATELGTSFLEKDFDGNRFYQFLQEIEKQVGEFVAFVHAPDSLSRQKFFSPSAIGVRWTSGADQVFLRNGTGPNGGVGYVNYEFRTELHHPLVGDSIKEGAVLVGLFRDSLYEGWQTPKKLFSAYAPVVDWIGDSIDFVDRHKVGLNNLTQLHFAGLV